VAFSLNSNPTWSYVNQLIILELIFFNSKLVLLLDKSSLKTLNFINK